MKFPIKDFFNKSDQIRRKLRIWSHLLKRSMMENFIFCAVFLIKHWLFFFIEWEGEQYDYINAVAELFRVGDSPVYHIVLEVSKLMIKVT